MTVPMCTPITATMLEREAMIVLEHLSTLELMLALRRDELAAAQVDDDRYEYAKEAITALEEARSSIETAVQLSEQSR